MEQATVSRFGPHRLAMLALAITALAGCDEGLSLPGAAAPEEAAEASDGDDGPIELFPQATSGSQRDVEAPDVFEVSEAGLWDGRPSLGGIWVAHPDVGQPERVVIKNTANNKSVTGALFRRDANLPGPALQVSSSAAAKLGMLAGAPSRLQVVALRREEIEVAPVAEEPTPEDATTEVAEAETTDEAEPKPAKRKWWQKKPAAETAAVAVAAGTVAGAASADAAEATESTPSVAEAEPEPAVEAEPEAIAEAELPAEKPTKRKWWQKKPAEETAEMAAAAGATAAVAAASATDTPQATTPEATQTAALADPEVAPPSEKPAKRKWWQKKDPNEITETPLDPSEGVAAAIEASEPTAATTTAAASTSALAKPFVQVGTFGVESNAKSAADKIRRNGMIAQVSELKTEDNSVWRVLVGPANTRAERRAILSDVKDLGFTDAFTAKN